MAHTSSGARRTAAMKKQIFHIIFPELIFCHPFKITFFSLLSKNIAMFI